MIHQAREVFPGAELDVEAGVSFSFHLRYCLNESLNRPDNKERKKGVVVSLFLDLIENICLVKDVNDLKEVPNEGASAILVWIH